MNHLPGELQKIYSRLASIPKMPGCYIWMNIDGKTGEKKILYVGKANSLRNRIRQYFSSADHKTRHLMARVNDLDYVVTNNELEALLLENNLIKLHSPAYNIRLKDDKQYPYLCLTTGEKFPRLILTRKKTNPDHTYYGPYSDVTAARNIMELIKRVFPIRKRNQFLPAKSPQKPCLNYHIGRCLAPCAEKISPEDYGEMVENIRAFLDSNDKGILDQLERTMKDYSSKFEYEKAAMYRNIISDIKSIYESQSVQKDDAENNYDVLCLYGAPLSEISQEVQEYQINPNEQDIYASQIVLLRIRNGNLINKTSYALTETRIPDKSEMKEFESELMETFLRDYYLSLTDIPALILLNTKLGSLHDWESVINQKTSWQVRIIDKTDHPDFQGRIKLIQMAENNARLSMRERLMSEKIRNQKFGLRQIQKFLKLNEIPEVVECYDISNIQGTNPVASGIMLRSGLPYKSGYRKYKIRSKETPDDPAMIYEAISRRLRSAAEGTFPVPDLMIIDGGITQLNAALRAREESGQKVKIISLAKKEETILTDTGETIHMDKNSPGMLIIRLARDEAHRFAVTYHRTLRDKRNMKSILDDIPGIGEARKKQIIPLITSPEFEDFSTQEIENELKDIAGLPEESIQLILQKIYRLKN